MIEEDHSRPAWAPTLDDYRAARIVMEQFGEGAECEVDRHAAALLRAGDQEGVARWMNVLAALHELRRTAPGAEGLQ